MGNQDIRVQTDDSPKQEYKSDVYQRDNIPAGGELGTFEKSSHDNNSKQQED